MVHITMLARPHVQRTHELQTFPFAKFPVEGVQYAGQVLSSK
jgi:hypothetical protein